MAQYFETDIENCYVIEHDKHEDNRGYFIVPFNKSEFYKNVGLEIDFVQDNLSFSHKNVVRGLHFQTGEYAQAKLVTCVFGEVIDVVVDLRKESPSFGGVIRINLGPDYNRSLFVPRGCAHGFSVLSENAIFQYKVDNEYNKSAESGILYKDQTLNIDWGFPNEEAIVSEKDMELLDFHSAVSI